MNNTVKVDPEKLVLATSRACLTIQQLSVASDLHRSTIYNALTGKNVHACTLGLIAKALCVDPEDLILKGEHIGEGWRAPWTYFEKSNHNAAIGRNQRRAAFSSGPIPRPGGPARVSPWVVSPWMVSPGLVHPGPGGGAPDLVHRAPGGGAPGPGRPPQKLAYSVEETTT